MRHNSRSKLGRGVSLVEVLATLVLVGVVLPAAMHGISLSLRAASWARHSHEAAMLAESKLNEAIALRDPTQVTGSGTFAPDFPDYRWDCQSLSYGMGLFEVSVTVYWMERGLERSMVLTTLVYPMSDASGSSGTIDEGTMP